MEDKTNNNNVVNKPEPVERLKKKVKNNSNSLLKRKEELEKVKQLNKLVKTGLAKKLKNEIIEEDDIEQPKKNVPIKEEEIIKEAPKVDNNVIIEKQNLPAPIEKENKKYVSKEKYKILKNNIQLLEEKINKIQPIIKPMNPVYKSLFL